MRNRKKSIIGSIVAVIILIPKDLAYEVEYHLPVGGKPYGDALKYIHSEKECEYSDDSQEIKTWLIPFSFIICLVNIYFNCLLFVFPKFWQILYHENTLLLSKLQGEAKWCHMHFFYFFRLFDRLFSQIHIQISFSFLSVILFIYSNKVFFPEIIEYSHSLNPLNNLCFIRGSIKKKFTEIIDIIGICKGKSISCKCTGAYYIISIFQILIYTNFEIWFLFLFNHELWPN